MESEKMSDNEEPTMSEVSDADTCRSPQKQDSFGKYKDNDYGINVKDDSDTNYADEDQQKQV